MSIYIYSPQKNSKLIHERQISFEEIIAAIANGGLLDVVEHPNKEKYKDQNIYVINVKEYIYLVPFVKDHEGNIYLKTIIPSRKAKKSYLKGNENEKAKKTSKK